MKTSKLSGYEVDELLNMVADIEQVIATYSHVSEKTPHLKKVIQQIHSKLDVECVKRTKKWD